MWPKVAALVSGLALFACSAVGVRETPEPAYTIAARLGTVEVRQYGARVAAETVVAGDAEAARSPGFRRLFDYISGANGAGAKIAMTAPVAQDSRATQAAMTAPMAQAPDTEGGWRIRFYMPAGAALAALPQPTDPTVKLVPVPPETLAVLRFSGSASAEAVARRTGELVAALEGSAWRPAGAPVAWFYDPPWTLPPLRRNEVAVPVSPR
jgi:hypothetical protein